MIKRPCLALTEIKKGPIKAVSLFGVILLELHVTQPQKQFIFELTYSQATNQMLVLVELYDRMNYDMLVEIQVKEAG